MYSMMPMRNRGLDVLLSLHLPCLKYSLSINFSWPSSSDDFYQSLLERMRLDKKETRSFQLVNSQTFLSTKTLFITASFPRDLQSQTFGLTF
jgi:hypothetical protein